MSRRLREIPPFSWAYRAKQQLRFYWRLSKAANRRKIVDAINNQKADIGLYYGNLESHEPQYYGDFIGLALSPGNPKEIRHNAYDPLPFKDGSVRRIQAQDVFEHLEYERVPAILDDIYRVLAKDGLFRLSVPDYRCSVHRMRSAFDHRGEILVDLMMGGSASYDHPTRSAKASFTKDGNAHVWFPVFEQVRQLIEESEIRNCREITFHHYYIDSERYVAREFPALDMPVRRAPPSDMRAGGAPVSIVVDFVK